MNKNFDLPQPKFPFYEGVYEEAPSGLGPDPWASPIWIAHCEYEAQMMMRGGLKLALQHAVRSLKGSWEPLVGEIKAALGASSARVRVIDIGGGWGDNYLTLSKWLPDLDLDRLDYIVTDGARSMALGERVFAGQKHRPSFASEIEQSEPYDIAVVIGTMHYINDTQAFLIMLQRLVRRGIFLARSPLAQGGSFYTVQTIVPPLGNVRGQSAGRVAVKVLGRDDLCAWLGNGWRLETTGRGKHDYSKNFARLPKIYQSAEYENIWFRRIS